MLGNLIHSFLSQIYRYIFTCVGALLVMFEPIAPLVIVCTLCVICDCYTAWSLSRRVKKKYPGANDGKFKSNYYGRVFVTLIKVYVSIILAFLIDQYVMNGFSLALPNIVAGAVCFWQAWSMLENESSCNDAKWARVAQRIMVDKTERHFDIDLSELKHQNENND